MREIGSTKVAQLARDALRQIGTAVENRAHGGTA
jgi:hypothetical protein